MNIDVDITYNAWQLLLAAILFGSAFGFFRGMGDAALRDWQRHRDRRRYRNSIQNGVDEAAEQGQTSDTQRNTR